MSKINWAQVGSLARSLTPFLGGLLVMRGIMNATQFDSLVNQIGTVVTDASVLVGALTPVATTIWGMLTHTDAAVVKAAGAVPGATVVVDAPKADPSVVSVAIDSTAPGVKLSDASKAP